MRGPPPADVSACEGDARWIDFDITLKATDGPVKFGDTKEGTFGLRIAETMRVEAKRGGRIVNSEGASRRRRRGANGPPGSTTTDRSAGETVGIAVINHPKSFRFPTYWHVRTYGLFAANPFGVRDFTGGKKADGSYTMPAGESISFYYRVLFHKGDEKEGKVADAYKAYAGLPK